MSCAGEIDTIRSGEIDKMSDSHIDKIRDRLIFTTHNGEIDTFVSEIDY